VDNVQRDNVQVDNVERLDDGQRSEILGLVAARQPPGSGGAAVRAGAAGRSEAATPATP
jgi:hypothetical protein